MECKMTNNILTRQNCYLKSTQDFYIHQEMIYLFLWYSDNNNFRFMSIFQFHSEDF